MRRVEQGFTLLEIMVAMVIFVTIAVGFQFSVGSAVAQQSQLADRALATWVAQNKAVELQVYQQYPAIGQQDDVVEMGGYQWKVSVDVVAGPVPGSRAATIRVRKQDEDVAARMAATHEAVNASLTLLLGEPNAAAAPSAN